MGSTQRTSPCPHRQPPSSLITGKYSLQKLRHWWPSLFTRWSHGRDGKPILLCLDSRLTDLLPVAATRGRGEMPSKHGALHQVGAGHVLCAAKQRKSRREEGARGSGGLGGSAAHRANRPPNLPEKESQGHVRKSPLAIYAICRDKGHRDSGRQRDDASPSSFFSRRGSEER